MGNEMKKILSLKRIHPNSRIWWCLVPNFFFWGFCSANVSIHVSQCFILFFFLLYFIHKRWASLSERQAVLMMMMMMTISSDPKPKKTLMMENILCSTRLKTMLTYRWPDSFVSVSTFIMAGWLTGWLVGSFCL